MTSQSPPPTKQQKENAELNISAKSSNQNPQNMQQQTGPATGSRRGQTITVSTTLDLTIPIRNCSQPHRCSGNPTVRRRQSVLRHQQHRNKKERNEDLPNCPPASSLMRDLRHSEPRETTSESDIDPYADLRRDIHSKISAGQFGATPLRDAARRSLYDTLIVRSKDARSSRTSDSGLRPYQSPPLLNGPSKIVEKSFQFRPSPVNSTPDLRGEIRERLAATAPEEPEEVQYWPFSSPSSKWGSQTTLDSNVFGPYTGNVSTAGLGSANTQLITREYQLPTVAPIRGPSSHALRDIYQTFSTICGTAKASFMYARQYQWFPYVFGIVIMFLVLWLFMGRMERWFISMFAALVEWIWPPAHFALNTIAGLFWHLADLFAWMDEFWRSLICDMAASYCRRYRILCDRQCSFSDRVMVRSARRF